MRGLVTLATAFALPADFPERDLLVLTAFAVVLSNTCHSGRNLAPMISLLKLGRGKEAREELETARRSLAEAAFRRLENEKGPEAEAIRAIYLEHRKATPDLLEGSPLSRRRKMIKAAIIAQREHLAELHKTDQIGPTQYLELQEDLDWKQLSVGSDESKRIMEG